jgi:hypothetical protein
MNGARRPLPFFTSATRFPVMTLPPSPWYHLRNTSTYFEPYDYMALVRKGGDEGSEGGEIRVQ